MPIEWVEPTRELHLRNDALSYVVRVLDDGSLGQLHLGPALAAGRSYAHLGRRPFSGFGGRVGEPVAFECPTPGSGDFRMPAVVVEGADGATVLRLAYVGHEVVAGKPAPVPTTGLRPMPATYVEDAAEADTVDIRLADAPSGVEVTLRYTIFRDRPVVARSLAIRNHGATAVRVRTAMSAALDLPDADWRLLTLSGTWARERHVVDRRLAPGRQGVASQRGASGLEHNPFLGLLRPATTEAAGDALGLSLVYSGNFVAEAEVDPFGTARARIGIAPEGFAWTLEPGAVFATPEAVLAWSSEGLGGLSDALHGLFRERLARGAWRGRPRPIVLNNWEATYFDFDEARIVEIATAARDLGVELFVLDDGWFGHRDNDDSSLGDWYPDLRKLPDGIAGLATKVEALGIGFGIWIEPEMVSPDSDLFRAHPDWAIGVPGRPRTESRQQLVLDMGRPEVVDHLFVQLSAVLGSAPVSYVKWDMNRNITEPFGASLPPERQGEFFHRYIAGTYDLYERLTRAFPAILFESCASGGGRFDPGLLAWAPQAWTSDDTDAIERLAIQWGTSIPYPLSSMAAHVSAVPNHQTGRVVPLSTRAAVAFFGVFGYELDPTALSDADRAEVVDQIALYQAHRETFQRGRFIRLRGPFDGDGNQTAWMVVAPDRRAAVVGVYRTLNQPFHGPSRQPLRGLDPAARYRVTPWPATGDDVERDNALVRGGDDLMTAGLFLGGDPWRSVTRGDAWARLFVLEAE
jgi:alpha-galactosidase